MQTHTYPHAGLYILCMYRNPNVPQLLPSTWQLQHSAYLYRSHTQRVCVCVHTTMLAHHHIAPQVAALHRSLQATVQLKHGSIVLAAVTQCKPDRAAVDQQGAGTQNRSHRVQLHLLLHCSQHTAPAALRKTSRWSACQHSQQRGE